MTDKVIAPDEAFREMIEANAQEAWLAYCKDNGIDPELEDETLQDSQLPF